MSADNDDDDFAFAQSFEPADGSERAAVDLLCLPTLEQLLCGHAFLNGSLRDDTRVWVVTSEDCWAKLDIALTPVLQKSVAAPSSENYRLAGQALAAATSHMPDDQKAWDAYRPFFYGAAMGCTACALQVSRAAMLLAMRPEVAGDRRRALVQAALGWVMATKPYASSTIFGDQSHMPARLRAERLASVAASWLVNRLDTAGAGSSNLQKALATTGIIVIPNVGNPGTTSGERVKEELGSVVGSRLALKKVPDVGTVKANLIAEFPHFASVVDAMLSDVTARPSVWIQPTLLFGKPGCGKSRFAIRFLEELQLMPVTYGCGGVADASLAGTARRWETSEPSLPLARVLATNSANPGVLLDELEKASEGRRNGSLIDALLGLLERQTSVSWFDPYVQAPVDLSHVCWLATANSLENLSAPLRDRFRVFRMPAPTADHLERLANSLVKTAVAGRNLDPVWAYPLDGFELEGLASVWQGGSMRKLARYVTGILEARERPHGVRH